MFRFDIYQDLSDISDSMQLDSGVDICRLIKDENEVTIEVIGSVGVIFDDVKYKYPSDFPQQLKDLIANNREWELDDRIEVVENNWFEITIKKNGEVYNYDTIDCENYSETDLLSSCMEMLYL